MRFLLFFLILIHFLQASVSSLYKSIDPKSLVKLIAFYELYPNTLEGKEAMKQVLQNLSADEKDYANVASLFTEDLFSFFTHRSHLEPLIFSESQKLFLQKISSTLSNRSLKGFSLDDPDKILELPSHEIDLSKILLLTQLDQNAKESLFFYESLIDLMALEVKARFPLKASFEEKISLLNEYLFFEKHFRFPPHSISEKQIDTFTLLPLILDEGKGVCLGISLLYLCLAQRLDLPLEVVTIPGHIFPRYVNPKTHQIINIETTLRGVDIPTENYLSFETSEVVIRDIKELPGLSIMNQASRELQLHHYEQALEYYEKARKFLPSDLWLKELTGYTLLFLGKKKEAENLFHEILEKEKPKKRLILEDYFANHTNKEGIELIFSSHDLRRSSILEKQEKLFNFLKKYPKFREGIKQYGETFLELGRTKEAAATFDRYLAQDPSSLEIHYIQCLIALERWNFKKAWEHFIVLESLLKEKKNSLKKVHFLKKHLELITNYPSN